MKTNLFKKKWKEIDQVEISYKDQSVRHFHFTTIYSKQISLYYAVIQELIRVIQNKEEIAIRITGCLTLSDESSPLFYIESDEKKNKEIFYEINRLLVCGLMTTYNHDFRL